MASQWPTARTLSPSCVTGTLAVDYLYFSKELHVYGSAVSEPRKGSENRTLEEAQLDQEGYISGKLSTDS